MALSWYTTREWAATELIENILFILFNILTNKPAVMSSAVIKRSDFNQLKLFIIEVEMENVFLLVDSILSV